MRVSTLFKIKYLSMLKKMIIAVAVLAVAACEKQIPSDVKSVVDIIAVQEGNMGTRSMVTDEGVFTWNNGDAIGIFNGKRFCELTTQDNTSTANFSGTMEGTAQKYAIFPYTIADGVSGDDVKVVLPVQYNWVAGQTNSPMLALFSGDNPSYLEFKHLCGLVKVSFSNVPSAVSRFVFSADKDITGDYTIIAGGGNGEIRSAGTDNNKSVKFNFPAGASSDMVFYVPVPVGTYKFAVSFQDIGGNMSWPYTGSADNIVSRASLIKMPVLDCRSISAVNLIKISDPAFKTYLVANVDTDGDGEISESEADAVRSIDVKNIGIMNLEGVEYFKNLQELNVAQNSIKTLDLTENSKLKKLDISDNPLTSLDYNEGVDIVSNFSVGHFIVVNGVNSLSFWSSTVKTKLIACDEGFGTWYEGGQWCRDKGFGWRLPTRTELGLCYSEISVLNDILKSPFAALSGGFYWSSEETISTVAYLVFMYDGSSVASAKTRTNSFRAVKTL